MVQTRNRADDTDAPSFHPRALPAGLLDLVFPPVCQLCGVRSHAGVCADCQEQLPLLSPPWCQRCGRPFPPLATGGEVCAECRGGGRVFDYCRSAGYYREPLREAVLALKYHRKTRLAAPLAELLAERLAALRREADLPAPDCLVPVPLHWRRRWRRGFNQSLLLCQELAKLLDRPPVEELLVRTRATRPQVGLKRTARIENLRGAFALRRGACVEGRNVVLVDDVMTTGATVNECAKMLKKAKCATVVCLTAARQVTE